MPIPPITTFSGQLPDQNDPATFPSRADALFQWLVQNFEPEANISIAAINAALNTDATVLAALTTLQERSVVAIAADWASVASADQKKLLVFTGATTYPLPAAASAGNGFHQRIFARGGAVSLDASSNGGTVNGIGALTIQNGEAAELFCDGTSWYAVLDQKPEKELILRQPATGASAEINFTQFNAAEFNDYSFEFENITISGGAVMGMQFSIDGGATWITGYTYSGVDTWENGASSILQHWGGSGAWSADLTNAFGVGVNNYNGVVKLRQPGSASLRTRFQSDIGVDANSAGRRAISGRVDTSGATNGVRFFGQGATPVMTGGAIAMYGHR